MELLYGICAAVGGTVLLCQFAMTLLGLADVDIPDDAGHSLDHNVGGHDSAHGDGHAAHHDANWLFGMITFRTMTAALTFFGLTGLAMQSAELGRQQPALGLVAALAAGCAALYAVHWLFRALIRLRSEGTVRIDRAIGQGGTVYLRIPGQRGGVGKVTLVQQNRSVEYQAMTSRDAIPTGAKIVVVDVIGPDTVEVQLAPAAEPTAV